MGCMGRELEGPYDIKERYRDDMMRWYNVPYLKIFVASCSKNFDLIHHFMTLT